MTASQTTSMLLFISHRVRELACLQLCGVKCAGSQLTIKNRVSLPGAAGSVVEAVPKEARAKPKPGQKKTRSRKAANLAELQRYYSAAAEAAKDVMEQQGQTGGAAAVADFSMPVEKEGVDAALSPRCVPVLCKVQIVAH